MAQAIAVEPYGFRVSWGAIFAGVVMATVTQFMLSLLGAGVGLPAIGPGTSPEAFGIGAMVWWSLSALVAMYVGGWFAARMAASARISDGVIHGILTWGVSTLLSLFVLTSAIGGLAGGVVSLTGKTAEAAKDRPEAVSRLTQRAEEELKARGVDVDMERGKMRDAVREQTQEARAKAPEKAEKAGDIGGVASFFGFLGLALGCLASAVGGRTGRARMTAYASV